MKRVEFLGNIFKSGGLLFLPLALKNKNKEELKELKIYHNFIRGLSYYDFQKVVNQLKENDLLTLKREPSNEFDKYAIEVYWGESKMGYLPRAENKVMANLMDAGFPLSCTIKQINKNDILRGIFVHVGMRKI